MFNLIIECLVLTLCLFVHTVRESKSTTRPQIESLHGGRCRNGPKRVPGSLGRGTDVDLGARDKWTPSDHGGVWTP